MFKAKYKFRNNSFEKTRQSERKVVVVTGGAKGGSLQGEKFYVIACNSQLFLCIPLQHTVLA